MLLRSLSPVQRWFGPTRSVHQGADPYPNYRIIYPNYRFAGGGAAGATIGPLLYQAKRANYG